MKDNINAAESQLVHEARAGNKESFCRLYGLYKDRLYRYALYRLGDPSDAEDAVSECVLAAWKSISSLRETSSFGPWIFGILHNVCAGMIRAEIKAREGIEAAGNALTLSSAGSSPKVQTSVEIAEAMQQLDGDEREIVLLSVISGLSSREISEITGLTPGSVRSKLSRSLTRMREYLS